MKKIFRFIIWSIAWTLVCYTFMLILGGGNPLLFPKEAHIAFVAIGLVSGFFFSKYYDSL